MIDHNHNKNNLYIFKWNELKSFVGKGIQLIFFCFWFYTRICEQNLKSKALTRTNTNRKFQRVQKALPSQYNSKLIHLGCIGIKRRLKWLDNGKAHEHWCMSNGAQKNYACQIGNVKIEWMEKRGLNLQYNQNCLYVNVIAIYHEFSG